jgi:hypothetical protein
VQGLIGDMSKIGNQSRKAKRSEAPKKAPPKPARKITTSGGLVWRDKGNASMWGEHHEFEAGSRDGGRYRLTPVDTSNSTTSYEVKFIAPAGAAINVNPKGRFLSEVESKAINDATTTLKEGVRTLEKAKAVAEQHHAQGAALMWKAEANELTKGHSDHTAKLRNGGHYEIAASVAFPTDDFAGYSVSFYPRKDSTLADREKLATSLRDLEKAKAIAEAHAAKRAGG